MSGSHPSLEDACEEGEHELVAGPVTGTRVCRHCRLDSTTITDHLGHDLRDGEGG